MSDTAQQDLLYYEDAYLFDFSARLSVIEETKEGAIVRLDRTAFYPEGGGQPADHGWIGGASVVDVKKRDGNVLHYLDSPPEKTEPGTELSCRVDRKRRYDYMQQHTGQHLLSAVLYRELGYQTVSVHQGSETTSIEIDTGDISGEEILRVEDRVLELISENRRIRSFTVEQSDISSYDLRREPKVTGTIRIVDLSGYDAVACGGVHTATAGELKLIRHVATEKIRGRTRLHWKIGDRAVADYREKSGIVTALVDLFSSPQMELLSRIESSNEELLELRKAYGYLEERTAELEARILLSGGEAEDEEAGRGGLLPLTASYEGESKDFLRKLADKVLRNSSAALCATNESEKGLQWIVALGERAEERIDFNTLKGDLLEPIAGKGGGKPPIRQGIGEKSEGTEELFRRFRELVTSAG